MSAALAAGSISTAQSLDLVRQACDALQAAHAKGIVHRDIKPSNIMLVDGPKGRRQIQLVDFGIAKVASPDEQNTLTQTGEVFGSPYYMSPEQCQGHKVDARSDVYALGCVLYELLTGQPPFKSESPLATCMLHINQPPRSIKNDAAGINQELENVVFKALAKSPSDRYQDAEQFGEDLARLQSHEKVSARAKKDPSKLRVPLLVAALVGLLAGCAGWWALFKAPQAVPAAPSASVVFAQAKQEFDKAVDEDSASNHKILNYARATELLKQALALTVKESGSEEDERVLAVEILLAKCAGADGQVVLQQDTLKKAIKITEKLDLLPQQAELDFAMGDSLYKQKRLNLAADYLDEAIKNYDLTGQLETLPALFAVAERTDNPYLDKDPAECKKLLDRQVNILKKFPGVHRFLRWTALFREGIVAQKLQQPQAAETFMLSGWNEMKKDPASIKNAAWVAHISGALIDQLQANKNLSAVAAITKERDEILIRDKSI